MHRNPQEKGDLAVSFDIEFPPDNFLKDGLMVYSLIHAFDHLMFYLIINN